MEFRQISPLGLQLCQSRAFSKTRHYALYRAGWLQDLQNGCEAPRLHPGRPQDVRYRVIPLLQLSGLIEVTSTKAAALRMMCLGNRNASVRAAAYDSQQWGLNSYDKIVPCPTTPVSKISFSLFLLLLSLSLFLVLQLTIQIPTQHGDNSTSDQHNSCWSLDRRSCISTHPSFKPPCYSSVLDRIQCARRHLEGSRSSPSTGEPEEPPICMARKYLNPDPNPQDPLQQLTQSVVQIRLFRAMLYHLYLQPTSIPPHALFQPVITSSHAPLFETDYNLHKSNSTYFSDMDISRTNLFTAIMRNGMKKQNARSKSSRSSAQDALGATSGTNSRAVIALGGISCLFKREILPYRKYEMWTRLLCWDRKWFYLITHLVKPGVGKPTSWTLQPWRKGRQSARSEVDREKLLAAVYATGIAKYVIKRGRITVPAEEALVDADMVPKKPEGWVYGGKDKQELDGDADSLAPLPVHEGEWNWDTIEAERLRGLKVAQRFAQMDRMHEYFDGGKDGVLGEFADLLF